jgi:hypothetical protein
MIVDVDLRGLPEKSLRYQMYGGLPHAKRFRIMIFRNVLSTGKRCLFGSPCSAIYIQYRWAGLGWCSVGTQRYDHELQDAYYEE